MTPPPPPPAPPLRAQFRNVELFDDMRALHSSGWISRKVADEHTAVPVDAAAPGGKLLEDVARSDVVLTSPLALGRSAGRDLPLARASPLPPPCARSALVCAQRPR